MSKELFVSSTPHETKVAIVEDDLLTEVYYERENEYTLAGSIYKGRVTRVLPGMQSAFVNIGLERDAFLYVSDFLLEEEDDTEGLEQVVSRSRPEIFTSEPRTEGHTEPIEAQEMLPPAGAQEAEEDEEPASAEAGPEAEGGEEPEREGARRWRGRRRRGRGRFQERGERGGERFTERSEPQPPRPMVEATTHATPEQHFTPQPQPTQTHAGYEPIILPGESLSKYGGTPAAQPEAPPKPTPRYKSKPSTEYSLENAQFSPGSMTLPGESLAKYRSDETRGGVGAVQAEPAPTEAEPREHAAGFTHPFTHPEEKEIEAGEHHTVAASTDALIGEPAVREEQDGPWTRASRVLEEQEEQRHEEESSHRHVAEEEHEPHRTAEDRERFEQMNVASVFGGAAAEPATEESEAEEAETVEESSWRPAERETEVEAEEWRPAETEEAAHQQPASGWEQAEHEHRRSESLYGAGSGVMEEEEIEEEESDLPGYEDRVELSDYEELEEQELARGGGDEQMVQMGAELTEAVRDAHVIEHATGKYEAEGLEGAEGFEEAEAFGAEEDEEGDELETVEEEEEMEGARAEMRAPTGTAGYQQRTERRSGDRRGRKFGRRMRGRSRQHVQRHLPAISDLLKEGQEILVQIAKEPIAKKGARITSHIALPGRFLVYMPTVHHTGVSRKIASEEERQRLKRIVLSERGEAHGGFIVRTAAAGANEDDLRADIRFLINLWNEIRGRAEKSKAPALIYHDLNLVERILRDQVTVSFSSIWVDTEQEYERILRFVSRFQPSLVKRVKLYTKETPLFEQFSVTDEINKALKSKVWLKSGGYIVINQTEALVAIDVNTGKFVGKTARLEDTIVKTNIDAIREIVRQIRLRDLGGIIVIDFIDMDERKNRQKVMQALEEALKGDRAPSKVLQFNDFGLVAITRKRVKQSLERTLGQPCVTCTGTGMIKSVSTVCNEIYVEMRKMARHFEHDIMLRVHPDVAKALKGNNARWLQEMEELTRKTILVKSDPLVHPEQFDIQ
jgi:ribonuclease E